MVDRSNNVHIVSGMLMFMACTGTVVGQTDRGHDNPFETRPPSTKKTKSDWDEIKHVRLETVPVRPRRPSGDAINAFAYGLVPAVSRPRIAVDRTKRPAWSNLEADKAASLVPPFASQSLEPERVSYPPPDHVPDGPSPPIITRHAGSWSDATIDVDLLGQRVGWHNLSVAAIEDQIKNPAPWDVEQLQAVVRQIESVVARQQAWLIYWELIDEPQRRRMGKVASLRPALESIQQKIFQVNLGRKDKFPQADVHAVDQLNHRVQVLLDGA